MGVKSVLFKERFKGGWTNYSVFISLNVLLIYFIRGLFARVFFKRISGQLFIGRNVTLRFKHHITAGKNLLIEDNVELLALSNRGIKFGNNVSIGKNAIIRPTNLYGGEIGEGLEIGDNSNIGPYSYIGCSGYIKIGNNVMMSPRVSLYAENHNFSDSSIPMKKQGVTREQIIIEDDCWLASNCVILAGVTIGQGSIIASGSVVTKDIPKFSVVGGIPAKVIKARST